MKTKSSVNLFTFQTPIIYDNSAIQAELLIYKGDLSVKSNSYLITFKDADPLGGTREAPETPTTGHLKCLKV